MEVLWRTPEDASGGMGLPALAIRAGLEYSTQEKGGTHMPKKPVIRGELALIPALAVNALGVTLMIHSGAGISAISSVPFALNQVVPALSLGTWTYLFQGSLVAALMAVRRRFVPTYLLSFVVAFCFGIFIDIHEAWLPELPLSLGFRVLWFVLSYLLMCIGISVSNCCKTPINPGDLFPRELSAFLHLPYARVRCVFDLSCVALTALLTFLGLGQIRGLGPGTVVAAFTLGKGVGFATEQIRKRADFVSVFER